MATHRFTMPQAYVDRVVAREGKAHTCETLHGPSTALVVVDLQNYYMTNVTQRVYPTAKGIVPNVNALAAAVRRAGGMVVWIETHTPRSLAEAWPPYQERHTAETWKWRVDGLTAGTESYALDSGLDVQPGDRHVVKNRFSAMIQGSSELEAVLRGAGIDTVLITGTATNVCCESTARDAMMLNFRVLMVSDANAAASDEEHAAALSSIYLYFGDVQTTAEVVGRLQASTQKAAAE